LQNDAAPLIINNSPFFDLLQRSKTPNTGQIIVQTAIADARGLSAAIDTTNSDKF